MHAWVSWAEQRRSALSAIAHPRASWIPSVATNVQERSKTITSWFAHAGVSPPALTASWNQPSMPANPFCVRATIAWTTVQWASCTRVLLSLRRMSTQEKARRYWYCRRTWTTPKSVTCQSCTSSCFAPPLAGVPWWSGKRKGECTE